ncbi:hypothetical protein [Alteromonas oceanisediminis]|uniref:hypothetical protein n=1 Tax=Alteromonas oceanisediminis TaxID=2836180 RepID=UPI001BD94EA4|nr:hypothetical protein [Alteromonas oceanisediminis]MBT0587594.1 hypothetical protein [Alteromonas oceanisediminis]
MKLSKLFKKRYPYSPVAYLGRKNVERIFGARIMKLKKLEKIQQQEARCDSEGCDASASTHR